MRDLESSPDGRSRIVGRAEHEERPKGAFTFEPGVGDTVESDAARVNQGALSGCTSQPLSESQHSLLGAPLQAGGDIREPLEPGRFIRAAPRSKQRLETAHIPGTKPRQNGVDQKRRPVLPARSSIGMDEAKEPIEFGFEVLWVTISGQAHDLAGIEFREAEINGHPLPEHSDRVRVCNFLNLFETFR